MDQGEKMSRFDYVRYDEQSCEKQENFKSIMISLEKIIDSEIISARAKALAFTKLEECYMWIGKGIRDDQKSRRFNVTLQEERNDS